MFYIPSEIVIDFLGVKFIEGGVSTPPSSIGKVSEESNLSSPSSCGSQFNSGMKTEQVDLTLEADLRSKRVLFAIPAYRDPNGESVYLISWSGKIAEVLLMGSNSEILPFIVPRISVSVVNFKTIRNFDAHQQMYNDVSLVFCNLPESNVNAFWISSSMALHPSSRFLASHSGVGGIHSPRIREVMQRSSFPNQFSGFRIIRETLVKKLFGGKLLALHGFLCNTIGRLIHMSAMFGLGFAGASIRLRTRPHLTQPQS
jgi:hypothetical protein